jgi:hypothetical protein
VASLEYYLDSQDAGTILSAEPLGWANVKNFLTVGRARFDGQRGCFAVSSMRDLAILPREVRELLMRNSGWLKDMLVKNIRAERPRMDPESIADMVLTFFSGLCVLDNLKSHKSTSDRKIANFMRVVRSLWIRLADSRVYSVREIRETILVAALYSS